MNNAALLSLLETLTNEQLTKLLHDSGYLDCHFTSVRFSRRVEVNNRHRLTYVTRIFDAKVEGEWIDGNVYVIVDSDGSVRADF